MTNARPALLTTTVLWCVSLCAVLSENASAEQPNVIVVLADDLGWSDLGCYGADLIETPHLDALASRSLRFTQAYAPAPVCTPTRAAIMTGKAPARLKMTIWSEGSLSGPRDRKLLQGFSRHDLPLEEVTLAEHFQSAGYLTALVGKWHLGDAAHAPETQGFDINIGGTHWGAPTTFFYPYRGARGNGEFRYVPHLELGEQGEYLTDRLTTESERIIRHAANRHQPFFLMLAHHAPHTPIEAKEDDIEYFANRRTATMKHQHPVYAAMIRSLDESIGRLMSCLRENGMLDNTVIVFASDNGGYLGTTDFRGVETPVTDNHPLRSGKGTCYEGGLRVPLIIHWPDRGRTGICDQPVLLTDLFPTLRELLRRKPSDSEKAKAGDSDADSISLLPVIQDDSARLPRETLYFHYPHYYHAPPSTPVSAIRDADWKLLEYFEDGRLELYDLKSDPSESRDVALQHPDRTRALQEKLNNWRKSVDASLPIMNTRMP